MNQGSHKTYNTDSRTEIKTEMPKDHISGCNVVREEDPGISGVV
jgi:hypothetical protein